MRGNGGGSFTTQKDNGKGKGKIDVVAVGGGKVTLGKDATEQMLLRLLVEGYLKEQFHASASSTSSPFISSFPLTQTVSRTAAYAVNSYLRPSSLTSRFTRLPPSQVSSEADLPVSLSMQVFETGKGGGKKRKAASTTGGEGKKPAAKKAKNVVRLETDDEDEEDVSGGGGGSPAFDFDDVDDNMFAYDGQDGEEDADALEALRQLEPSSDGVDEDGWAGVKTASKPRGGRKKSIEVLELDD